MDSHDFAVFIQKEGIVEPLRAFLDSLKNQIHEQVTDKPLQIEAYTSVTERDYYIKLIIVFYRIENGMGAVVQNGELVGMDEYLDAVSEFTKDGSPLMKF